MVGGGGRIEEALVQELQLRATRHGLEGDRHA